MTAVVTSTASIEDRPAPDSCGRVRALIEATRRLRHSGYLALRDVSCDVQGEFTRLHGRVPTHYVKQMAQAIVAEVEGVCPVVNLIEVTVQTDRSGARRGSPPRP